MLSREVKEAFEILKRAKSLAVVGATPDQEKYGYKIFEALKEAGYQVFPVNPKYDSIGEVKCFPFLQALPVKPEMVVTVVPPEVTAKIVDECYQLGLPVIWMQPGSWREDVVDRARDYGLKVVHDLCLLFSLKSLNSVETSF
jgi:predicted CoA-binding protein